MLPRLLKPADRNKASDSFSSSSIEQVESLSNSGNASMKPAISQYSFLLFLILSAGVHALFWLRAPNPLKQPEKSTEIEVVGTVPVVNLPKKKTPTLPKLPQVPAQETLPTQSDENTKSALLDSPKKNKPEKIAKSPEPEKKVVDPAKSDAKIAKKAEPKVESKAEPKTESKLDPADELTHPTESQTDNPTKKQEPQNKNTNRPDIAKSGTEPEESTAGATLSQDGFNRQFVKIYAEYASKYGKENVVQRIVPSPRETTISQVSQSIEPGIDWIPPVEQPKATDIQGKNTKVIVTLIVDSNGKLVKKWMFSSKNSNVDEIVKKTVKGYESKFTPLEGKIRIVTINYDFSGRSNQFPSPL